MRPSLFSYGRSSDEERVRVTVSCVKQEQMKGNFKKRCFCSSPYRVRKECLFAEFVTCIWPTPTQVWTSHYGCCCCCCCCKKTIFCSPPDRVRKEGLLSVFSTCIWPTPPKCEPAIVIVVLHISIMKDQRSSKIFLLLLLTIFLIRNEMFYSRLILAYAWWCNKPVMSFAQVVDTRATRPFPSSLPTNLGREKGRRRQTIQICELWLAIHFILCGNKIKIWVHKKLK